MARRVATNPAVSGDVLSSAAQKMAPEGNCGGTGTGRFRGDREAMKYLIVNGDDFGASRGITRGILEAHSRGILTSASLMVDMPFSAEAARMSRDWPNLSVGLHIQLTDADHIRRPDSEDLYACEADLRRQLGRFQELLGRLPTHLDSHHNVHLHPRLWPCFLRLARQHGVPLRGYSRVRCIADFYGQWDGVSHPEQVSVAQLSRILRTEIGEGWTELACHPGWADPNFRTGYSQERELELETLCDPRIRAVLREQQIDLRGFGDLADERICETSRGGA
jgi:chitin disaccharide deacetylase